jgi:hypothetical protein
VITLLLTLILGTLDPSGANPTGFRSALTRLGLSSALVISSQAVDEQPLWSPDGDQLAVSVEGKWSKLDLGSVSLQKGTWHGDEAIGVASPAPRLSNITAAEVGDWQKSAKFDPRRITTKNGMTVELEQVGLGTVFRTTKKGQKPAVFWKTSLENCHSLTLSPDETLVAYICELNGVVVTVLEQ